MPPRSSARRNRPLTWRLAVVSVVVFAIGLAVVGVVLARQQTLALMDRFMVQAEGKARHVRNTARKQLDRELVTTLRRVADQRRADTDSAPEIAASAPGWIDGLFLWDGAHLTVLAPASRAPEGFLKLLTRRLAARPLDRPGDLEPDRRELVFDRIGDAPVVIGCLRATDTRNRPVVYAARIDPMRLKTDLIEPQLAVGDGLEVVPLRQGSGSWSHTMGSVLRCWVVRPTEAFIREQRNTVIGQTLAYFGLTILALMTVLAAMWFLVRVARRDFALAELKSNFVADVSHELKTPLALIRLFGETLLSGRVASQEKRQEYYAIITRESTRLTNLINNILDFARIEAGRKEYRFHPTDVGQVVRQTYETYTAELDHDGFEHRITVANRLPRIDADADAISQVLVNLIGNAVKYSGTEHYLAIDVTRDTRRGRRGVLIAVQDRGIGISPEDRAHLFDGFFRASDGRVDKQRGAGLGLALVKHIVDAHHGSLEVESRLVKGSTFRVFLPASERGEEPDGEGVGPGEPAA